jgi:hypothetical protein
MTIPNNDVAATLDEIAERIRGAPDRYERAIAITAFRIACRENGTAHNPALEAANRKHRYCVKMLVHPGVCAFPLQSRSPTLPHAEITRRAAHALRVRRSRIAHRSSGERRSKVNHA